MGRFSHAICIVSALFAVGCSPDTLPAPSSSSAVRKAASAGAGVQSVAMPASSGLAGQVSETASVPAPATHGAGAVSAATGGAGSGGGDARGKSTGGAGGAAAGARAPIAGTAGRASGGAPAAAPDAGKGGGGAGAGGAGTGGAASPGSACAMLATCCAKLTRDLERNLCENEVEDGDERDCQRRSERFCD